MRRIASSARLCLVATLFFLLSCREELPHVDDGKEPGAYGVPGGSIVLRDGWQLGILRYGGNRQNVRLVHPARARVITLSGLPRPLRSGMEIQVLYRETEQGYTRVCLPYKLQVVQVEGEKVWLKESDHTFFVLEL